MSDLPRSRRALESLARRGKTTARRVYTAARERRTKMVQLAGAGILLPLVRDLSAQLPGVGTLGVDPKIRTAIVGYIGSEMLKGDLEDASFGVAVGAVGAYTWESGGILGNLFGGDGG